MLTLLCTILLINVIHFPNVIFCKETEEKCSDDCNEPIYCNEEILHAVQLSEYVDSCQGFVDMKLRKSPQTILENFKKVRDEKDDGKKARKLQRFIQDHFEPERDFSKDCEWEDFPEMPNVDFISDENYRNFYKNINKYWKQFAVKVPDEFDSETEKWYHSIVYVPHCYVRKDESGSMPTLLQAYWIIRGMLINRMFDKVEQMLRNYAYLIKKYKYVPYTNRVYALDRAQYPLFALMVEDYINRIENSRSFLDDILPAMEIEFNWWSLNRRVKIKKGIRIYRLFRYIKTSCNPRPEVYKKDYRLAKDLQDEKAKKRFYSALRCLNECDFGFSKRFIRHKKYPNPFLNLKLSNTIPVELNSVLHRYSLLLGKWYTNFNDEKADRYYTKATLIKNAIRAVLWSPSKKMWFDYDYDNDYPIEIFYPTNLMPLFTFSYHDDEDLAENTIKYLLDEKLIKPDNYPTYLLLPTTKQEGWLWDFPFGSLFLTAFVIEGLRETENDRAIEIASHLAQSLIKVVHNGHELYDNLLERYDILPNSQGADDYTRKNEGKISAASLGCVITMLRWYGGVANSADYESVLTADYYSSQELVFAPPPKLMDMTNLDSESEEITPTETDNINELDNSDELRRAEKRQKTQ